jgi:uncharacterized membrane protein YphA (DoxX/SURF4 family)
MRATLVKLISNRYLALAFRLYIGGVFFYASMYKINFPGEFAEMIANYQLVPFWAVNLLAVFLPWTELICGFLLVMGVRTKSAAAVAAGLLAVFTVAVAITLVRGIPLGCGCFSAMEDPMTWGTVARDLAWLAMTLHVYWVDSAWQVGKAFVPFYREL